MPSIKKDAFGKLSDGREATIYTLRNIKGNELKITNYGARIVSMRFRNKDFQNKFVLKSYDDVSGYSDNLLLRAADVCIKERRTLIIVPREMPFSRIHLRNMKELADMGVVVMPPVMTFYNTDMTLQSHINHVVNKILSQLGLPTNIIAWNNSKKFF